MILASYNERLLYNILIKLGVPFIKEFSFEGCRKRYDFLIDGVGIVELHGGQHYPRKTSGLWTTYEKEHDNDLYKYDLAVYYGYNYKDNYFIINCNSSSHSAIYDNIHKELGHLLPISLLNKEEVLKETEENNIVFEICEYFENNNHPTPFEMRDIFNIHHKTIIDYLHRGYELGICSYTSKLSAKEQREKYGSPMKGKTHSDTSKSKMRDSHIKYKGFKGTHVKTGETIIITSNRHELKEMGFQYAHIVKCCNGERNTHKGYRWEVCD